VGTAALRGLQGGEGRTRRPRGFWKRNGGRRPHRAGAADALGTDPTGANKTPAPPAAGEAPAKGAAASAAAPPAPPAAEASPDWAATETTRALLAKPFWNGIIEDGYSAPYEAWAGWVDVPAIVPSKERRARVAAACIEVMRANPREWMKWAPAVLIALIVSEDVQHGFQAMAEAKRRRGRPAPPPPRAAEDHPARPAPAPPVAATGTAPPARSST